MREGRLKTGGKKVWHTMKLVNIIELGIERINKFRH